MSTEVETVREKFKTLDHPPSSTLNGRRRDDDVTLLMLGRDETDGEWWGSLRKGTLCMDRC